MYGMEGIAKEFDVPVEVVEEAYNELKNEWDEWVEKWRKKESPEGLAAVMLMFSTDLKDAVNKLVEKEADLKTKLKTAITLDVMVE